MKRSLPQLRGWSQMIKLDNFTKDRLKCKCGCGKVPLEYALIRLQALRYHFGEPMVVNSGARCANHNIKEGGAPNSRHLVGDAFDISTRGWLGEKKHRFMQMAFDHGCSVSMYNSFIHIDFRPRPVAFRV